MKKQIIIALATLTALPAVSQEKWDLRKCIDYAIEHNLSIKQQEAARDQNAVDLNTAKYSRLPNRNGNVGQSFNFGRALQADNTYGDRNTKNTNFSLSTSIPLFTGLRIPNNIALSKLNLKAATEDLNKAKEDISISVTSAYLQILFNEELAKVAHNQVELSREQLELKEAYFKNGKASEAEVYEARARVAQDEMSAVQADNNYQLALLELSQLLELPTPDGFGVVSPRVEDNFTPFTVLSFLTSVSRCPVSLTMMVSVPENSPSCESMPMLLKVIPVSLEMMEVMLVTMPMSSCPTTRRVMGYCVPCDFPAQRAFTIR